jgi:hypothetical protein
MTSLLTTIRRVLRLDAQQPEETTPSENILAAARAASGADEPMPPTPEASIISAPALTEAPLATAPPQESAGARIEEVEEEVEVAPVAAAPAIMAESAESGAHFEPVAMDTADANVVTTPADDPDSGTDEADAGAHTAQGVPAQISEESAFMGQSAAPDMVNAFSSADAVIEPKASAADDAAQGDAEMRAPSDADAPETSAEAAGMPITGGMASYAPFPSSPDHASPAPADEDDGEEV